MHAVASFCCSLCLWTSLALSATFLIFAWLELKRPFRSPTYLPPFDPHLGYRPEPDWLSAALLELPRRNLSTEEADALDRDGVILVTGVINSAKVLDELREVTDFHRGISPTARLDTRWHTNGVLRALVRDGPIGALAASALGAPAVRLVKLQVEATPGSDAADTPWSCDDGQAPGTCDPWLSKSAWMHNDLDAHADRLVPLVSVFVALTGAPDTLRFLAGSHKAVVRHRCRQTFPFEHDLKCFRHLLEASGGTIKGSLLPGDAFVSYGQTYHWSVHQEEPTIGITMRFVPADALWEGPLTVAAELLLSRFYWYTPWECEPLGTSPLFPIVFPEENSTVADQPFPLLPHRVDALYPVMCLRWAYNVVYDRRESLFRKCRRPDDPFGTEL